jgi:hypothetical protein
MSMATRTDTQSPERHESNDVWAQRAAKAPRTLVAPTGGWRGTARPVCRKADGPSAERGCPGPVATGG